MDRVIITISREFGSGGRLIGKKLADDLGIGYYDRKLIELAAEKSGLSPEFIAKNESRTTSSFLYNLASSSPNPGGYALQYDLPVQDRAFFAQASVIRELAETESCVIVGRCAGFILREDSHCINVFIHSSLDDRLKRAVDVYGMERGGLADILVKTDKGRANYHKYYTGESWYDSKAYDIVVNTGALGTEGAVEVILSAVKSFKKHKTSLS